ITLQIQVSSGAALGPRTVVITHNGTPIPSQGDDQFKVNPPPTVTSAGTGVNGLDALLSPFAGDVLTGQTVLITGTGFQAPTTAPPDLLVAVGGTGISVTRVEYTSDTQIIVTADVLAGAEAQATRTVSVTNPDGGTVTSGALLAVQKAPPDRPDEGLTPTATSGTVTAPVGPTVASLTPAFARIGAQITLTGSHFSAAEANNLVTFTGPGNRRVVAPVKAGATQTVLKVDVPATAVDGPITVAVSGVQQSTAPKVFTVTNPSISAVTVGGLPASGQRGSTVAMRLTGSKFQDGVTIALTPAVGLTVVPGTLQVTPPGDIAVQVSVAANADLGLRDVTVTNPDGASDMQAKAFEVTVDTAVDVTLALKTPQGALVNTATVLPSIGGVQVTLDGAGQCTSRTITPSEYVLEATITGAQPSSLTMTLTSSNLPGTASNADCEPNIQQPEPDFSIGSNACGGPPVTSQQGEVAPDGDGVFGAKLASWDWGGSVRSDVTDSPAAPTMSASLTLPADLDRDGLPDVYEDDPVNLDKNGVNVLDRTKGDRNGN